MSSTNHSRKLGALELADAPPNIVNLVVPTKLHLNLHIDTGILSKAVKKFIYMQPNMRSGIKRTNKNKAKFVALEHLKDIFEILPIDTNWLDICNKYSNCLLREDIEKNPPIKVFFIPLSGLSHLSPSSDAYKTTSTPDCFIGQAYLIVVYCHYSGDGTNGMTIVDDILNIYESMKYDTEHYSEKPLPPSADDMAMSYFRNGSITKNGGKMQSTDKIESGVDYETCKGSFIDSYMKMYESFNYFLKYDKEAIKGCKTTAQYYTSSTDTYHTFIDLCKTMKVTVGSVFIAAAYFGVSAYAFQDINENKELFIGCNLPINLRGRVPLTIPNNCVNASICQNLLGIGITKETTFLEFMKKVSVHLNEIMDQKFCYFDYGVMKELLETEVKQNIVKKHGVDHQFTVSNMRKYPRSTDYRDFKVDSIHLAGGLWLPTWDHLELMIYSTDKFNLSLVHRDGTTNTKVAKYIFDRIIFLTENLQKTTSEDFTLQNLIDDNLVDF